MLGATGSGKTAFLNLFANLSKVTERLDKSFANELKPIHDQKNENLASGPMNS